MEKYGEEILEGLFQRILTRVREENWDPFYFIQRHCDYMYKKMSFCFENGEFGFRFTISPEKNKEDWEEDWLEHMEMDVELNISGHYGKTYLCYEKIVEEPEILRKIYRIAKEEIKYEYNQNKHLRLKYVVNDEEVLKISEELYQALKEG